MGFLMCRKRRLRLGFLSERRFGRILGALCAVGRCGQERVVLVDVVLAAWEEYCICSL